MNKRKVRAGQPVPDDFDWPELPIKEKKDELDYLREIILMGCLFTAIFFSLGIFLFFF